MRDMVHNMVSLLHKQSKYCIVTNFCNSLVICESVTILNAEEISHSLYISPEHKQSSQSICKTK